MSIDTLRRISPTEGEVVHKELDTAETVSSPRIYALWEQDVRGEQ
jgi:hypothetical protein